MTGMVKYFISLVNPRFHNFSNPLLLAVVVGLATLAATAGMFVVQVSRVRVVTHYYTTPQPTMEISEPQYIDGFNGQVATVKKLRFGGSTCTDEDKDAGRCGLGPKLRYDILGGETWQPVTNVHLSDWLGDDVQSFFREAVTTEQFIDRSDPNKDTEITVTTRKRTTYAVCAIKMAGFILPDVSRVQSNMPNPYPASQIATGVIVANGTRSAEYASNIIHVHPQVGSWNCNPPNEFFELKDNDMDGDPFYDPAFGGAPGPGHFAEWTDHGEAAYGGPLPVCGDLEYQPPAHGGSNTMPFYPSDGGGLPDSLYKCTARGSAGGNELPVIASYRTVALTEYEVTWTPLEVEVPTTIVSAIGTALAYSTYFEMLITVVVLALLVPGGVVTMTTKVSMGKVVSGAAPTADESLLKRIADLEIKVGIQPPRQAV